MLKNNNNKVLVSIDSETVSFLNRVKSSGGELSINEIRAINYWISEYKYTMCDDGTNTLWDKIIAYAPLVGGTAESCSVMLKWEANNITWHNTTSGMFTSNGYQGSPPAYTYGDSGLTGTNCVTNDTNISMYSNNLRLNIGGYEVARYMGYSGVNSADYQINIQHHPFSAGNSIEFTMYRSVPSGAVLMPGIGNGYYSASRLSNVYMTGFRNGVLNATNTVTSSTTVTARKILFGASSLSTSGVPDTANNNRGCSPASHQSFFVGKGFTANEEFKRYQIEETTQRMLGRAAKK